jgi:Terminase large subunit, T4likevirus-type, N-terminal/Terminase RNaseH-like domain
MTKTIPIIQLDNVETFKANPRLKKTGQKIAMTVEQVQEMTKCTNDPQYFMENYVEIVTSDEGITQFKMRKYQKRMIQKMHKNNRVIMRAARQSGKTETCSAYILWYLLFNVDRTCAILANKEATATEIVSRVQGMYMRVPLWMQQGIEVWNTTSFLLENGSRLISSATSSDAIRGFRIDLLYLDEYAHVDNAVAMDFFTSVYPTISSGKRSKVIISSTPKGMNHFYKMFTDAQNHLKSRSQFKHITVKWDEVPGRNKLWMEDMKLQLGEERFMQEQEVEFMGSGGTLISSKALRELAFIEPLQELLDHKLKIYEDVIEGHRYVIAADVSHGKELDYSAMSVFDVTQMPYKVVATYHSNEVPAELYPSIIAQVGQLYNMAYVLCESNDIGSLVVKILIDDLEYDNVFYTEPDKIYKDTRATEGVLRSPGLKTSNKTKRQGCNTLKQLVERKELIVQDFETISELASFVIKKNKTYAADDGKHDDCVMTLVLFGWLTTQQFFKDLAHSDARSELYKDAYEQIAAEIPLPPMIDIADPGPGRFKEDGVIWEEATWENGDLKWSGHSTLD